MDKNKLENENRLKMKENEEKIDQDFLESKAESAKDEILNIYQAGETMVKELGEAADATISEEEKQRLLGYEMAAKKLTSSTNEKIDQESKEPAIDHLPNYIAESKEAKLVEMIPANEKIQKRFDEKISPDMKEAVALVCSQVFNKGKYPYALIGSNCYIPHTEHSEKIPDDLDIIFGIKDLGINTADIVTEQKEDGRTETRVAKYSAGAYAELVKLQEKGLIKDLSAEELRRFGKEKNGCVKVHCLIKTANGWKEMEAFAQNMDDEISNQGKKKNGIINLGAERQRLEVIDIGGVKANIGDEKVAEELYLKNIVNEFALYSLNGWENRGMLNAKALQRMFNVINLDSQEFEDSIDQMIRNIGKIDPPTSESEAAQEALKDLWEKFKSLPEKETGLVDYLMEKNGIEINSDDKKRDKIITTEKATDLMTFETRKDMKDISSRYASWKQSYQRIMEEKEISPEKLQAALDSIDNEIAALSIIGKKYKDYLNHVNSADKNDFCVYAAMPQLRNRFILPVVVDLMKNRKNLEKKLSR